MQIIDSNNNDDHFKLNLKKTEKTTTVILYLHGNTNDRFVNLFRKNNNNKKDNFFLKFNFDKINKP